MKKIKIIALLSVTIIFTSFLNLGTVGNTQIVYAKSASKHSKPTSMTVYGKLKISDVKKGKLGEYVCKSPFNYVHIVAPKKNIKTVRLDFIKTPILLSDKDSLKDYYSEYMEKDSKLKTTIDDTDFIFYSKKINKEYEVKYQANTEGEPDDKVSVKQIFIKKHSENNQY